MGTTSIIATNILRLLDDSNVTISDLAKYLEVTRQTLTNYLKGTTVIDSVKLIQIAQYFDVPVDELVGTAVNQKASILFRTALNYQVATDDLSNIISNYIEEYCQIAKQVGKNVFFLPEQYNLQIEADEKLIDINFELKDYTSKYKVNDKLDDEIARIASEQRRLLGLEDQGAIALIPALTARGVNVIFIDFKSSEVSGLSICDDNYGSFIFINDSSDFTAERKIFTLAHEYGHILLHRPLFNRRIKQYMPQNKRKSLLDSMADCFAGHLLCPYSALLRYSDTLNSFRTLSELFPVKLDLQISLQSLMTSLRNHDFISSSTLASYFSFLREKDILKSEPCSFEEDKRYKSIFNANKDAQVISLMKPAVEKGIIDEPKLSCFLNIPLGEAQKLVTEWNADTIFDEPIN